jgi:AAA+ superfamily predicted ATPase
LALAAFPESHWSALVSAAPLRRWRLIEVGAGDTLTQSPLRIDERILHYLNGLSYLDDRLQNFLEPVTVTSGLPASHEIIASRLCELWSTPPAAAEGLPLIQLSGPDENANRSIAASAAAKLSVPLYEIDAADLPTNLAEREALMKLWQRETMLSGGALLVDFTDHEATETTRLLLASLERLRGMILFQAREPLPAGKRSILQLEVAKPPAAEQRAIWKDRLGRKASSLNGQLASVAAHFRFGVRDIDAVGAQLEHRNGAKKSADLATAFWDACRTQARHRIDNLAQRIEPAATWDDLVLAEGQKQILREITAHLRQRETVYEQWGFAAKGDRGLGLSALFTGASGTGKTMAAEVLARELRLDLYRIDLSTVVSKYIGETEKNLRRVFDAAEQGGAILLFDEADALFGKRSEVRDSHDRYANIEVSYLLQRMETYRGLAILTTNLKSSLDSAFLRRLRFVVTFPFPDAQQRAEIWRRIFPTTTPTEGLEPAKLAKLNVAGGNIRNVALNAAFLAADAEQPVRMIHLLRAARAEYAKLEKPLTEAEIGGWA